MAVVVKIPDEPLRGHGQETGPSGSAVVVTDPGRAWRDDQRGVIITQALLILPIFILAVFGGFEVWKILSIKQSLHSATYQAARYLSLNPVASPRRDIWESTAWQLVCHEMRSDPFAMPSGRSLNCEVDEPPGNVLLSVVPLDSRLGEGCSARFRVRVEWRTWVRVPYLNRSLVLSDEHTGRIEC